MERDVSVCAPILTVRCPSVRGTAHLRVVAHPTWRPDRANKPPSFQLGVEPGTTRSPQARPLVRAHLPLAGGVLLDERRGAQHWRGPARRLVAASRPDITTPRVERVLHERVEAVAVGRRREEAHHGRVIEPEDTRHRRNILAD
eukprot:scaffold1877_cov67-Phaeocystis_antarctica.AAC.1